MKLKSHRFQNFIFSYNEFTSPRIINPTLNDSQWSKTFQILKPGMSCFKLKSQFADFWNRSKTTLSQTHLCNPDSTIRHVVFYNEETFQIV